MREREKKKERESNGLGNHTPSARREIKEVERESLGMCGRMKDEEGKKLPSLGEDD